MSKAGFYETFHDALRRLESVQWRETMFEDLQVFYAEEGVYVLRCRHGDPNEHYCIIRAESEHEAISRAVFDLHKAGERRVGRTEAPRQNGDAQGAAGNAHERLVAENAKLRDLVRRMIPAVDCWRNATNDCEEVRQCDVLMADALEARMESRCSAEAATKGKWSGK